MMQTSSYDGGQMADVQSVRRPGPGPTANWLETPQSKQYHHQQQQQQQQLKEDGEPVTVRVMTNGSGAASERSDNYVRPFGGQNQQTSPSHLSFLYERAQQPVKSPLTETETCRPNGFAGMTSSSSPPPRSDEYRSLGRAVPAPVRQQQRQQASTATEASSSSSCEYNASSRATPAPIHQQTTAAVSARRPASTSSGEPATPTSPRRISDTRAAEVPLSMSIKYLHSAKSRRSNLSRWRVGD